MEVSHVMDEEFKVISLMLMSKDDGARFLVRSSFFEQAKATNNNTRAINFLNATVSIGNICYCWIKSVIIN